MADINTVIPNWGSETLTGFDLSDVQTNQPLKSASSRQFVRFYNHKFVKFVPSKTEVTRTGEIKVLQRTPEECEMEMVEIRTPGDKNQYDGRAELYHKRNFPRQYAAFRSGKTAVMGIPIEECPFVSPAIASELRYQMVHTAEQLADASDNMCGTLPDGFILREYARAMVKAQTENKSLTQVNALKGELEMMKKQLEELKAQKSETTEVKAKVVK